jgi:hypothetical protein
MADGETSGYASENAGEDARTATAGTGTPSTVEPARPGAAATESALVDEVERILDDVDDALERLESGRYGVCEACGEQIADERLATLPTARTCDRHPQLTDPAAGTATDSTCPAPDRAADAGARDGQSPPAEVAHRA